MSRGGSRPGSGRKPKSPAIKDLKGTRRPDREHALPAQADGIEVICPLHLSDLAKLYFDSIVDTLKRERRANPHHAEHYALLAQRLEQIQRYQAVLACEGDTYTSETPRKVGEVQVIVRMIRARPEVTMLSEAMRQAQSLLGELMLNPAASLRIMTGPQKPAGDFDDF